MDAAVTRAWQGVAQPKGISLEASRENLRGLANILPQAEPAPLRPIVAADLMKALAKAKLRRSPGERGWHVSDLRALPELAWQQLAGLINAGETNHQMPIEWSHLVLTMIPKGTGGEHSSKPLSLRPIGVLPTLARIWARARVEELLRRT
eukprot:4659523-Amphidinium_carterae.1